MNRRMFLKASGVAMGLPWLDAQARAQEPAPRRLVAICTNLGLLEKHFFPAEAGRDYAPTPYLETLKEFRDQMTVFSGVSHPDVTGGHSAEASFLTAAPHPGTPSFRNTISLDQYAAERIGIRTRVPALSLCVSQQGNPSLSWTASGVMLPAERNPAQVFKALFVDGDAKSVERQVERLRVGQSIMDAVAARASELQKGLGAVDRDRLEQYFTSVREVEQRLKTSEAWEQRPKPKVDAVPPKDEEYLLEKFDAMAGLIHLALATDSTRLVTLMIRLDGFGAHVPGVSDECHSLSHHVGREDKQAQLKTLELAQLRRLAGLLKRLQAAPEAGGTLLDRTSVLYGSNLGNGNNHDTKNMPVLLAGGGFRHAGHLAFDRQKNYPLPNLFVSILQRLGLETDRFASSTGTMKGLELV